MGQIKEFPGLQIDNFKTFKDPPLLCLLTHAHSDHLLGLDRQNYYGPLVYCTATTRSLVLNLRGSNNNLNPLKYNHLRKENCGIEILQALELDKGKVLRCGDIDLKVTAIDAHHCPGSCMFLVQSETSAILYTGDIRCEKWFINMLAINPCLLPYTHGNKPISIYMDNIYEQHQDNSLEYFGVSQGIGQLISLLDKKYPDDTPLCAVFTTTGYENVLISLAEFFNTKIHMDPYYYSLYNSAADTCPVSRALVERSTVNANSKCRIHWCKKGDCALRDRRDAVYFSPCVTISQEAVNERNRTLDLANFDVAGQCDMQVYANAETGARYVLSTDGHTLLPGHILFYYSRHASRPCLTQLIDAFTVKTVHSLDGDPMQGFSSFQSSGTEEIPTDESQQPLKCLPIIRKQPVRLREKPPKRVKFSAASTSSSSNDEALMFLQGGALGAVRPPQAEENREVKDEQNFLETQETANDSLLSPPPEKAKSQQTTLDPIARSNTQGADRPQDNAREEHHEPSQLEKLTSESQLVISDSSQVCAPENAGIDADHTGATDVDTMPEDGPEDKSRTEFKLSEIQSKPEIEPKPESLKQEASYEHLGGQDLTDGSSWFSMRFDWQQGS